MEGDDGNNNGSKRRRIALACRACRTRKSRCDGQRPICSACKELNFDCVYVQSSSSSNIIVGKEYLSTLEERLALVEQRLGDVEASTSAAQPTRPNSRGPRAHFDEEELQTTGQANGIQSISDEFALQDSSDGMGAMVFTDEEDCGFFGPSSNIAFTRHISRALSRTHAHINYPSSTPGTHDGGALEGGLMSVSRPPSPSIPSRPGTAGNRGNASQASKSVNIYALPPEQEALDLFQQYFSNTGSLFPFIHEESFLETYEAMKRTKFTKVRRTWLGLFNILLAFGMSTSRTCELTAERRAEVSEVYYQRAVGLCDTQVWRGTSLELVQYLLLMGQYLQGTQRSIQTWTIHGLAVKAAFQLGLHSSEASKRFSPLEREIRKRTWFGCVVLDRTLSMTFGRPAAIPESYVKLDFPVDYEAVHLSGVSKGDPRRHISVQFFVATIALYKIMYNAVDLLYGGNIGCDTPDNVFDTVSKLFQMEHQLVEWENSLPINMGLRKSHDIPGDDEEADPAERFRLIITLRYHNLRILVHRLVVVRYLDTCGKADNNPQEVATLQQIGANSIQICIQSAMEIITIVSLLTQSTGQRRGFLGFWWFSLYYTFNAALVVFACILIKHRSGINNFPLPDALDATAKPLQVAVEALHALDQGNRMVEKCTTFLERLGHVLASLTASPSTTMMYQPMPPQQGAANMTPQTFQGNLGQNTSQMPIAGQHLQQSPLGMDLGEFMIESDLDFLNYFRIPASAPSTNGHGQTHNAMPNMNNVPRNNMYNQ